MIDSKALMGSKGEGGGGGVLAVSKKEKVAYAKVQSKCQLLVRFYLER